MSGDRYTRCPRCSSKPSAADRVKSLYGTIPADEFERRLTDALSEDARMQSIFREDYEFAIEGDKVTYWYGGTCEQCGFRIAFQGEHKFNINEGETPCQK